MFGIGLLILSPIDEILILLPLSQIFGLWVFPLSFIVGFICLAVGGVLIGKHILPLLRNPIVIIMLGFTVVITVYLLYVNGWLSF